jgi:alpha-L-rhamnosidase
VLALCLVRSASAAEALRPAQLRTEWLTNPLGLDAEKPRLSWRVESEGRGQRQTAYRLLVASSLEKLQKDEGDLWDSEKVESDETLGIGYAGKALFSGQEVFWKVKVWDKEAKESAWSETAMWSMGLLKPEDWQAQWISFKDDSPVHADRETLHLPPARLYGNDFAASKPVRRAMLYASALGLAEFHLNGQKIGDAYFEPGWSDYRERAWYRAHDVTDLVRPGANRLGAVVADGWYAGYVGYGLLVGYGPNQAGRNFYGRTPALLAQLEIEYADGSREIVGTDASWQVTSDGPYREADLIMGETFDARRTDSVQWKWEPAILAEQNGSVKAAFRDALGTREVELGFQKPKRLQAYSGPAIRVTEELKPHRLTEPAPGVYIFDLGQNLAGNVRLEVKGPAGTKIQLRYGEMLHPDGRLMTENLRKARATDTYLLRGDPEGEVWTPRFTYHGFQYVEVTGLPAKPALGAITGLVIQSDTPMVSSFACSDEVLTKFWQNTRWTQRANFIELPTDCPQRDERLGWMGDAQIYVRTATFNADVAAFFTKWLDDLEEAQRDSGAYPDYAPYPMAHGKPGATHGTAWTDAGVICPWTIWKVYGDTRVIERHWNSMRRFMDWRRTADPNLQGVELGNTWGDWLNVNEDTPIEFIDLCYHAYSCRLMAEMAEAIGRNAEAESYRIRFEEIQKHFVTRYARPDGDLGVDTQTAYVLGLWVGLLPEQWAPKAAARLAEKIEKNGFRMATGFLGTKALLPVLTANGHHDLAVRLFQSRQFPSWGYEVVQGATTVWERWDSFTKEHGFDGATGKNNAAMNSFSHYAFGAVAEWMFRDLAGIDTEGAGYRRIVLKPGPPAAPAPDVPALDWAKAETTQARGRIASAWTMDAGRLAFNVTIPANTTAIVSIPAKSREGVTESEHPLDAAEGVKFLRMEGDRAICEIESGSYQFRSAWP